MIARVRSNSGTGATLVYVPGIDGTGRLLLSCAERLERRFRLICLCYEPGPQPPARDSYEGLAASVLAAVGEIASDPPILLSESFGGAVALRAALDHPESVAAVAVVNGFARHPSRARLAAARFVAALMPDLAFRIGRRHLAVRSLFGPRQEARALADFHAMRESRLDAGYRRRLAMIAALDLLPELGRIERPVALFASDRDRVVDSVPAARAMAELLPHAELEILRDAGHVVLPLEEEPWVERMEALARRAGVRPPRRG